MLAFIYHLKSNFLKCRNYACLRSIYRKFGHWLASSDRCFRNKRVKRRHFRFKDLATECFKVKLYCRFDISKRLLKRVSLPNDNPFHANRISNIPVGVFLDNDLDCFHTFINVTAQDEKASLSSGSGSNFGEGGTGRGQEGYPMIAEPFEPFRVPSEAISSMGPQNSSEEGRPKVLEPVECFHEAGGRRIRRLEWASITGDSKLLWRRIRPRGRRNSKIEPGE